MALNLRRKTTKDGPEVIRPLRTIILALVSVAIFNVTLTLVARSTADNVGALSTSSADLDPVLTQLLDGGVLLTHDDGAEPMDGGPRDAGHLDAGHLDAGHEGDNWQRALVDAGPLVWVSADAGPVVDAGPPTAPEPPFEADDVANAGGTLVERCSREALRWDPSLGGAFTLVVALPAAGTGDRVVVRADGLRSPVLARCLQQRSASTAVPGEALGVTVPLEVRARASLTSSGTVTIADAAILAAERIDEAPNP